MRISPKKDIKRNERILFSTQLCSSGIFDLYFEDGSGMNSATNSVHIARRAVVCQVFQDLSNFINAPAGTRINFWVRNLSQIPNVSSQTLGVATGFYNLPSTSLAPNFSIADNEIWKTIHAGVDSYTNVTSPITSTAGLGSFYHGMMAINFNNLNWNLNLNATALSNQLDLYTVVLHEVTHALGFASLIDANGNSKFGENFDYYSRYDTFLVDHESKPLITNQNSCNEMYNFQFTVDQNILHPNCTNSPDFTNTGASINATVCINSLGFLGNNNVQIPIYTPQCFENGSSLSHFEDQCYNSTTVGATNGNDLYFVISNANGYGTTKRFLKSEERQALCDMGYRLNSIFGNTAQHSFINYGGLTCNGSTVAGINDGMDALGIFTNVVNVDTPLQINPVGNSILDNDVTINQANLRFECVEDISFTGSLITVLGNNSSASITFQSPTPGMHLLRYVPFDNVSGNRGNITYIYVFVRTEINNCGVPSSCNMILNGDFEQNSSIPFLMGQFDRVCGWKPMDFPGNTPDYYFRNNNFSYVDIPCNFMGIQESTVVPGSNNGYAGFWIGGSGGNNFGSETIINRLNTPLLADTNYTLQFDLSLAEGYSAMARSIQVYFSNSDILTPFEVGFSIVNPIIFNTSMITDVNNWTHISINFTTDNEAGEQFIYIGGLRNVPSQILTSTPFATCVGSSNPSSPELYSYYYIDNVSLIPIPNDALNLPTLICQSSQLANLTDYLGVIPNDGIFTGDGVVLNNNIFTFNPSNLPTGIATITYTFRPTNGCQDMTISNTIMVTASCALPFISQVYGNSQDNSFIEVKNPSTTDSVDANTFFLNLYQDGVSTTLAPTSFIDIGILQPNEVKVFQVPNAFNPSYAVNGNILPVEFVFDGSEDIITISTTTNETSYNFRTDLAGNSTDDWSTNISLVRSSCATIVPRIDVFDYDDWARFELLEIDNVYTEFSRTNPVLGRHIQELLSFEGNGEWRESPINYQSYPERSRFTQIRTTYNTDIFGSFECCSLDLRREQLIINENDYVSIENNLMVHDDTNLRVENNGSLVMVKDQYNGLQGNDLIQILGSGQVRTARTTVGLDATTDYVYWSTPLANIPENAVENTPNILFPSPPFNSSRFFEFINANFQDIPNWFNGAPSTEPYANGYDDNLDDYHILTSIQRAQQLIPGIGYLTWPPSGCSGAGCNYTINFRGKPNNGIITVPVYHNEPSNSFANLIGNPYPSAIDLDRLFEVNAGLIDPVAYVWGRSANFSDDTPSSGNPGPYVLSYSVASFMIYNPILVINPNQFNLANLGLGTLASCQSFFVQTVTNNPDADYSGNLIFNNSMRTKVANNTFARQSSNEKGDKLWLNVLTDKEEKISQTGFAFLENASDDFSRKEDVKTFRNNKTTFYSIIDNLDLVINVQSPFKNSKIIPLGITTSAAIGTELSISIDKKQGVFNNQEIYIYDKFNNSYNEISSNNFTFKVTSAVMDDRFILVFDKIKIENQVELLSDVNVVNDKNNITVKSENGIKIKSIEVFDIYSFSINGLHLLTLKEVNTTQESFTIDEKYKLLLIVTKLYDGSTIYKKIIN